MTRKQPFTVRLTPENKAFVASASEYFGLSQAEFIDLSLTKIRQHAEQVRPDLLPPAPPVPKAIEGGEA